MTRTNGPPLVEGAVGFSSLGEAYFTTFGADYHFIGRTLEMASVSIVQTSARLGMLIRVRLQDSTSNCANILRQPSASLSLHT